VTDEHPARAASRASMAAVTAQDREGWLALWSDDACVEDPVGPSWLDPTGEGHRGKEAIGAFFDSTIATLEAIRFEIIDSFAAGKEVANVGTIHLSLPGGTSGRCEGVFVYRVDDAGLLVSLRAFWEVDRMTATMTTA
jgi:steroid delta-isomerase